MKHQEKDKIEIGPLPVKDAASNSITAPKNTSVDSRKLLQTVTWTESGLGLPLAVKKYSALKQKFH